MRFPDTIKHKWVPPGWHDLPTSSVISINGAYSGTENASNPNVRLTPLDSTYYRVKYKLDYSDPKGFLNCYAPDGPYESVAYFGFQIKPSRFETYPFFDPTESSKHNYRRYITYE